MSTVQILSTGSASAGTYQLAGGTALAYNASASTIQAALATIYGAGNVLVCEVGAAGNTFAVMFVGTLWGWGQIVPTMSIVDNTTPGGKNVSITTEVLPNRIDRLFQYRCTIYQPVNVGLTKIGGIEMADQKYSYTPFASNVPCAYDPTPNYSEPKGEGATKLVNIMTADKWTFLSWLTIYDRWMVVMTSPADNPLCGHPWVMQGNSKVVGGVTGRPSVSQELYGVLGAVKDIP